MDSQPVPMVAGTTGSTSSSNNSLHEAFLDRYIAVHSTSVTWPDKLGDPILIVAGNHWDGLASSERHLGLHLAEYAPIVYVDPPRIEWPRQRRPVVDYPHPSVMRVSPVAIRGMYRSGLHRVLPLLVCRTVNRVLADSHLKPRATIVAAPTTITVQGGGGIRVTYATDDWVAGAELMGVPQARMRSALKRQVRTTDLVVAVSETLATQYRRLGHPNVEVVPNGCDAVALANVDSAPLPPGVELDAPVAGFVGNLSDRIDFDYLVAVADRGISLLLVGPRRNDFAGNRFDELIARPNVQWVGPRPYAQMPSYLRMIDVGLTPYADTAFNRASSPLKTIEYLAAGRGSVATDLPGVRALGTDQVIRSSGPAEFAEAVERECKRARTATLIDARRAVAASHDWSACARQVLRLLELSLDSNQT